MDVLSDLATVIKRHAL